MHRQGYWLKWQDYEEIRPAVKSGFTSQGLQEEMKKHGIEL